MAHRRLSGFYREYEALYPSLAKREGILTGKASAGGSGSLPRSCLYPALFKGKTHAIAVSNT